MARQSALIGLLPASFEAINVCHDRGKKQVGYEQEREQHIKSLRC